MLGHESAGRSSVAGRGNRRIFTLAALALCSIRRRRTLRRAADVEASDGVNVVNVAHWGWSCVKNCGACCYLSQEDRPYLSDLLTEEELIVFHDLIGSDGWCRHFNKATRSCNIYEDRPSFCRVKTWLAEKADGFGVDTSDKDEVDAFCAACCREHIRDVHGADSPEMQRFDEQVPVGIGYDIDDEVDEEEEDDTLT